MTSAVRRLSIRAFLWPVDIALAFVGPKYKLYFWVFSVAPPRVIAWLGRLRAVRAAHHARRKAPAYRRFLAARGVAALDVGRLRVPATDKANYVRPFPPEERCLNGELPMSGVAIDESSGSTGTPYNWIRSLQERHTSQVFISHFARYCFGDECWITINAFSMGAWATGINMGMALQLNSVVKNTGPNLDKIFNTLEFFGPQYRYLVCGYPPFLKHMIDVAQERGFPIGEYRLMALLGGEGNSEGLRDYLRKHFDPVFSGYGASDVEIGIAGETPISLAIRREARHNPELRKALFGADSRLPMLFQYNPLMHYIETNEDGELIFTISRLNVLAPRIRYNIHDEGGVATFQQIDEKFRSMGIDLGSLASGAGRKTLPLPFLWVYGRKDSTVSVMGANIYPEDIEECLYAEPGLARATSSFCLSLHEANDGAPRPCFSFEIREPITAELQVRFDERMVRRLQWLNADYRESLLEYADAVAPVIRLYPPGEGPFAGDSTRIKQTRLVDRECAPEGAAAARAMSR